MSNSSVSAILSDDGRHLVTLGGKTAQLWSLLPQTALPSALLQGEPVDAGFFSPDGRRIATRGGNEVRVWDLATSRMAFPPLKDPLPVIYAEFSPDGTRLVSCCRDDQFTKCYAQVWDVATQTYVFKDKYYGRDLKAGEEFQEALTRFLYNGADRSSILRHIPTVLQNGLVINSASQSGIRMSST